MPSSHSARSTTSRRLLAIAALSTIAACSADADDDAAPPADTPSPSDTSVESALEPDGDDAPPASAPDPVDPGSVVIGEVHYHPADDADPEFVELVNVGDGTVDLAGWCVDGFGYCFPADSELADGDVVVVDTALAGGRLDNGGERLELVDAAGGVVDAVEYDDRGNWPALADGEGWSLHRRTASEAGTLPGNWFGAEPTPGETTALDDSLLPTWTDVGHTVTPEPGAAITVDANLAGGTTARVEYVVGFGETQSLDADLDADGSITVEIPGHDAGVLVRFRLVATADDGTEGTWPRQGDGAGWTGTVVASDGDTDLPRIQWFMPDDTYAEAAADLTLTGDDGYPAVVAIDGIAYSDAKVRVKGASARGWPKPKFKFTLPAGHEAELDGFIDEPVDEFAIHAAWNDKTFAREYFAARAFQHAGQRASDVFPVQVERNGEFFGLYLYVEQPDGTWRGRHGFDDDLVYDIGARGSGFFSVDELSRSTDEFRLSYSPETPIPDDDVELRRLIEELGSRSGDELRSWIHANVDVPHVLNFLAVSSVIQHQDFWAKNVRVMLDEHGRWSVTPHDLELTYGRRWYDQPCQSQCDIVDVSGAFDKSGNPLWGPFSNDPVLSTMLARRIETLTEELLQPERLRGELDAYAALIGDEAARDRATWGTFGEQLSAEQAIDLLYDAFAVPQYERLTGPDAPAGLAALQPQPDDVIVVVELAPETGEIPTHLRLTNESAVPIDVSGTRLDVCDVKVPPGTVLPAGGTAVLVDDAAGLTRELFDGTYVAGFLDDIDRLDRCAPSTVVG